MQMNPYLFFNGTCEAALKFYAEILGGKVEFMLPYRDMPPSASAGCEQQTPAEWQGKIAHGRISIPGGTIMGSDAPPGRFHQPQGFSVNLGFKEPAEADRVFHALAEKGNVTMPIAETFWAHRFGMVVDRFGTPWMVNCEKERK